MVVLALLNNLPSIQNVVDLSNESRSEFELFRCFQTVIRSRLTTERLAIDSKVAYEI